MPQRPKMVHLWAFLAPLDAMKLPLLLLFCYDVLALYPEMAKSSGWSPVFSQAQSWSPFFVWNHQGKGFRDVAHFIKSILSLRNLDRNSKEILYRFLKGWVVSLSGKLESTSSMDFMMGWHPKWRSRECFLTLAILYSLIIPGQQHWQVLLFQKQEHKSYFQS